MQTRDYYELKNREEYAPKEKKIRDNATNDTMRGLAAKVDRLRRNVGNLEEMVTNM